MDILVVFIPLLPLIAAAIIGMGHFFGTLNGDAGEVTTARIATVANTLSCLLALTLLCTDLLGKNAGSISVGQWLHSGFMIVEINFVTTGFNVGLAALFLILLTIVTRFSINYLHRESGFHRFFFILSLFSSAMLLLVLSGSTIGTFIGWEIAGLCSYLLIAFAYDRPVATTNATRVFVTVRIGDACFILGICLSYYWIGFNWNEINTASILNVTAPIQLTAGQSTSIALCFAIAAFAKSAQLPFTSWLARAMEGPTPSSAIFYGAVMTHAGVYLVILLQPIFEHAPFVMTLLLIVGLMTAVYSFIVGLTQTDVKSSLSYAISGQLGLMFMECGLGFWQLASWHLCAHAIVRCYQVLTAPSFLNYVRGIPMKPVTPVIGRLRWLYIASLQRFWLDPIAERFLIKLVRGFGHDLAFFDDHIVDRVMGTPVPTERAISSLKQLEERILNPRSDQDSDEFSRGSGLAGKPFQWIADIMYWFENRLVLRGVGMDTINLGRKLGHLANRIEQLILKPQYLLLFIFIALIVAF
jgi:NADH:ubiquinone oxidoreductase subunit 5 (subunit L)/multisubunit Na+/H+ antiporter MnhA subunit